MILFVLNSSPQLVLFNMLEILCVTDGVKNLGKNIVLHIRMQNFETGFLSFSSFVLTGMMIEGFSNAVYLKKF